MPITPNNNGKRNKRSFLNIYWMYLLIFGILIGAFLFQDSSTVKNVNWTEFSEAAARGDVSEITVFIDNNEAEGLLTSQGGKSFKIVDTTNSSKEKKIKTVISSSDAVQKDIDTWNDTLAQSGKPPIKVKFEKSSGVLHYLWFFGPTLLFIGFLFFMSRRMNGGGAGGGIFSVGKSKAKVFDKDNSTNVTFKDVAGLAEAKVEVEEIVEFLKNPQRYTELGAKIPKGALLVGPPGTGKTLLAKAVAGEANVPFLSMSGSDFVEMFVGVGAARVRDLFKQAKEKAPCIIFIDEIDAVGRARGKNINMGSNDERENTLNQMLTEMDGFGTNNGVIILAATNRADMLDQALLRPGRFDRQIYVDLPELSDRVEIFNVHLRDIKFNSNLDVDQLARQTQGFSGADIANVCNEAALIAARNHKQQVEWDDFMAAIDRIVGGLEKRSRVITDEEKFSIATHEAGHATISWMLKYGDPLVKVTIVPRGRALGAAWYAPEGRQIVPTQALLDTMCGLLGGRAAEEVFTGQIGTGASNDLERCTKIARNLVMVFGMGKSIPNMNYYDSTGQDYGFTKPFSEETARRIDEEVIRIVSEQYERAKSILREHAEQHNRMRDLLVEKEVIFTDDVREILGPRKWKSRTDEISELNEKDKAKDKGRSNRDNNPQSCKDGQPVKSSNDDDDDPGTPPPFKI